MKLSFINNQPTIADHAIKSTQSNNNIKSMAPAKLQFEDFGIRCKDLNYDYWSIPKRILSK